MDSRSGTDLAPKPPGVEDQGAINEPVQPADDLALGHRVVRRIRSIWDSPQELKLTLASAILCGLIGDAIELKWPKMHLAKWLSSLFGALVCSGVLGWYSQRTKQVGGKLGEVSEKLEHLTRTVAHLDREQGNRLENVLRSHALFSSPDNSLGVLLRTMEETSPGPIRWMIAKAISLKLGLVFANDSETDIAFKDVDYGFHSEAFARLACEAKEVCLTCILDPAKWFDQLAQHCEHPYEWQHTSSKWKRACSAARLYPAHYLTFLSNAVDSKRTRIFILDNDHWKAMAEDVTVESVEAFCDFVGPCEHTGVATWFVHRPVAVAHNGVLGQFPNFPTDDCNLFDNRILAVWTPHKEQGEGPIIGDLLLKIINGEPKRNDDKSGWPAMLYAVMALAPTGQKKGVYSVAQMTEIIRQQCAEKGITAKLP